MRHVDEGTIHAWLDGQITDPAEVAWIEEHLRWCAACGAQMAEERAMFEQANALLAVAAPAAESPPFDALVAKAGHSITDADATSGVEAARGRRWLLQLGWAASLALAVGLGWMARDVTEREPAAPQEERRQGVPADQEERRQGVPADQEERRQGVPADRQERRQGVPADQVAAVDRAAESVSNPAGSVAPAPSLAEPSASASAARDVVPVRPLDQQAAVDPRPEPAAVPPAREQVASVGAAPGAEFESARRRLEEVSAAAPIAAPPAAERVAVTGNSAAPPVMTRAEWQPLARTEAAARSGMALYGIDGLTPTLTAISADGRVVRTVYRLESGATLEMEQQREIPDNLSALATQAARARSAVGLQRREGIAADVAAPDQRIWSGLRGDARITLRTPSAAADLEALGMKLRVD